jgi:5-methylcytosine-specific restriction endonuclease McrA
LNEQCKKSVEFNRHNTRSSEMPGRHRAVSALQKKVVGFRQDWKCAYCHCLLPPGFEVDHCVPVFLGGSDDAEMNLQALCPNCHASKSLREGIGRCYSKGAAAPWCAECEVYYSPYFPHAWHWRPLKLQQPRK